MVGGKIIEIRPEGEKSRLWVMDHRNGDECAIYIDTQTEMPQLGDDIWWQSRVAYWTPADHRFTDRPIPRVGYSFRAAPLNPSIGSIL